MVKSANISKLSNCKGAKPKMPDRSTLTVDPGMTLNNFQVPNSGYQIASHRKVLLSLVLVLHVATGVLKDKIISFTVPPYATS